MINFAVEHIVRQTNEFLRRQFELAEDIVVLSNLLEQDGTLVPHVQNKIAMFLVSIERDVTCQYSRPTDIHEQGRRVHRNPPVGLNLYLMVAAHFSGKNYPEALKILSSVVQFFQTKPVFDHQNSPELDDRIDQLILDIENLSLSDQALMWGALSGRYLPSVLYKVRMISLDGMAVQGQVPALSSPVTNVGA